MLVDDGAGVRSQLTKDAGSLKWRFRSSGESRAKVQPEPLQRCVCHQGGESCSVGSIYRREQGSGFQPGGQRLKFQGLAGRVVATIFGLARLINRRVRSAELRGGHRQWANAVTSKQVASNTSVRDHEATSDLRRGGGGSPS